MYSDSNVKFKYNELNHTTICERKVHDKIYYGTAKCHPQDYEFESKLVGEHYAYMRSLIDEMCQTRNDLRSELKALRHLYDILAQNNKVSKQSIECYAIRRQIKLKERDIQEIKDLILDTKTNLRQTIKEKDELYARLRTHRDTNSVESNSNNG